MRSCPWQYLAGGKGANEAVACGRLDVPTYLIGRVGADDFGRVMIAALSNVRDFLARFRPLFGPIFAAFGCLDHLSAHMSRRLLNARFKRSDAVLIRRFYGHFYLSGHQRGRCGARLSRVNRGGGGDHCGRHQAEDHHLVRRGTETATLDYFRRCSQPCTTPRGPSDRLTER